jgi:CHAT domain-containing protein
VDVLLRSADARVVGREDYLDRALRAVEALKSAELQDYFRDECVVAQESQALPVEQVARDAAVLYPIVLPDRVELLLRTHDRLIRRSVAIDQATLSTNALQLRELVQSDGHERFLPYSQRMYRWLVAPVAAEIAASNARTLVVVPDGVLRLIPFAVLNDGERFLIQKYALATTPSLTLTAPQPLRGNKPLALLTGVARPVQGFSPLPKVSAELAGIREHVNGAVLMDGDYTTDRLAAALTRDEYAIVHMATHSVVGDTPADSYLLTYDGRLSISELEELLRRGRFRRQPVELLTLSACETAIGDERAALGLAGIALKAGARSALATLWRVSDDSSAALMKDFYAGLASATSKAAALRDAQLKMLEREATSHPAHWAAFMLIGNWL